MIDMPYYDTLTKVYIVARGQRADNADAWYVYANKSAASGPWPNAQAAWTSAERLATSTTGHAIYSTIPAGWTELPPADPASDQSSRAGWLLYEHR